MPIQHDHREEGSSIRSRHQSDLQAFCGREIGLTLVGRQKNLAFGHQRARHVKEIYSSSTSFFRMRRGQLPSSIHGKVHVHDHLLQSASLYPASQARQSSVSFVDDYRPLARGEHPPLVNGSLPNAMFHFQRA